MNHRNPNRERGTLVLERRPPTAGVPAKPQKAPQQPKAAKVEKPKGPVYTAPEWTPGWTPPELLARLPGLMTELHPVFRLGVVVPLALGAGPALVEVARPGCRQRVRRWIKAYTHSPAYLTALAADGAMRHDRTGRPVESVDPDHQAEARRKLRGRGRRGGAPLPLPAKDRSHGQHPREARAGRRGGARQRVLPGTRQAPDRGPVPPP